MDGNANDLVTVRWIVPADDGIVTHHLRCLLDDEERRRADLLRFDADRNAYVAAHALLRVMLSRQCEIAPQAWRFRISPGGKPEIDPAHGRPELRFSLSHTRGMVACAVGRTHDLGIDVEACEATVPFVELAAKHFAPSEARLIAGLPPTRQGIMFYRIWTLKEAYLKAIGTGIAAPLDGFAFALDPVSITFPTDRSGQPDAWQFAELLPGAGHRLALAVRCPIEHPLRLDKAEVQDRKNLLF